MALLSVTGGSKRKNSCPTYKIWWTAYRSQNAKGCQRLTRPVRRRGGAPEGNYEPDVGAYRNYGVSPDGERFLMVNRSRPGPL